MARSWTRRECVWLVLIVSCAFAPRLWFVTAYATRPVSDFRSILLFARSFVESGYATGFGGWQSLNPALPFALSLVLRVVPGNPAEIARYATATVLAVTTTLPFLLWRDVLSIRVRVGASLLLALWPGQITVAGVLSQDNWVLLPSVGLACLAVRTLVGREEGRPVAAGLLLTVAGMTRQEMLVVLLPLAAAAGGLFKPMVRWHWRQVGLGMAAGTLVLLAAAGLRWAGSGRFTITTEHAGVSVLGSYSPGGASSYWTPPQAYAAALVPELANNWQALERKAMSLALEEALRRPRFHLIRIFSAIVNCQIRSDSNGLQWSVGSADVLPFEQAARAQVWLPDATIYFEHAVLVLFGIYFAVMFWGVRRRSAPLMTVGCSILLKLGVHGITTAQPRYFSMVTCFALLAIALAGDEIAPSLGWREAAVGLVVGAMSVAGLAWAGKKAEVYILAHEKQPIYRFALVESTGFATLRCTVREGLLMLLSPRQASIRPLHVDPAPHERAVAECRAESVRPLSAAFEFQDAYLAGGLPGRVVQSVSVDGVEIVRHDIAAVAGASWIRVPLGTLSPGDRKGIMLVVEALLPESGWTWGIAATTPFRLVSVTDGRRSVIGSPIDIGRGGHSGS